MALFSFSPFSFFIVFSYIFLLIFQCSFDTLEILWVLIELLTFVFIGIALTISNGSFVGYGVVSYFITQSMLSMTLLISIFLFRLNPVGWFLPMFFFVIVTAKLGGFPFSSWYYSSVTFFPSFILLVALTLHNVPLLYILHLMLPSFLVHVPLWVGLNIFMLLNLFLLGVSAITSSDLRSLIINTSIGNNSWMILASLTSGWTLALFLAVYFLTIVLVLSPNSLVSNWGLFSISGLPPFPIFFINLFVLWSLLSQSIYTISFLFLCGIMLFTLLLSFSYIRFVFSRYVSVLSSVQ